MSIQISIIKALIVEYENYMPFSPQFDVDRPLCLVYAVTPHGGHKGYHSSHTQWFLAQKRIMSWYIFKRGVMVIKEVE